MSEKLKLCPFCGGEAEIEDMFYGRKKFRVECTDCSASMGYMGFHLEAEAIAAWNTRIEQPKQYGGYDVADLYEDDQPKEITNEQST